MDELANAIRQLAKMLNNSKRVYISGAITNEDGETQARNIERFNEAEKELLKRGYTVLNPAKSLGFTYKQYMDMSLNELMQCNAIYMLDGYEKSKGALLELHYAQLMGYEVIHECSKQRED